MEVTIKTNSEEIAGAAHEFPIPEGLLDLLSFSRILGSPDQSLLLCRGRGGFRAEPPSGFCERKPRAPLLQRSHCAVTLGNIPSLQGQPGETPRRARASNHGSRGQSVPAFLVLLQKRPLKEQETTLERCPEKCPQVRSHLLL